MPANIDAPPPSAFVLIGATGDLARRMLWPSLYALHVDGLLPPDLRIIGAARAKHDTEEFRKDVAKAIEASANAALCDTDVYRRFAERITYTPVDVARPETFDDLKAVLGDTPGGVIYYISTAPDLFAPVCADLKARGLVDARSRLAVEKPIGKDLASARQVNDAIAAAFDEDQVFRVDHYLGKETVQNLVALRFGNSILEPLWNASAIDSVQITIAETVGVEGRWGYYDTAGALRDMVQNHLLQLLCLTAMEPPASFTPSAVRNEKVKVLWSLNPITAANVEAVTVPGQYSAGVVGGKPAPGYREEEGANQDSTTETFVAIRAEINNWRWAGVPFYLRTGKRMQQRLTEIVVQFKPVPYSIFTDELSPQLKPNRLVIRLQPEETVTLTMMNKQPGLEGMKLKPVALNLSLAEAFSRERRRIAYERLLLDILRGNSSLFVRRDEIEAAWAWIDGILEGWRAHGVTPKPYPAGSWGPTAALVLPAKDGRAWAEEP
ncbi:glucose-6-phosphate dehydrogenase [Caulobacter sp. 17J80-11]|uniref:glucose-6-phosphate dehydrogenase n=1 Tax=Caulobacter sp. 17J80-11 TaxID=2763502 RepID=UPI001653447A|nr:glucose-6-phosphate dehydrogenase [Caulobacter sp. 17J80-11]MBC6983439.1 glucose-6-phosphate dehydrogenase [Caulobacter sp. 17J80-11]